MLQDNFTPICKMTPGETYNRPVLVLDMSQRTAKTGNTFVSLKLTDGDTQINVNAFDTSIESMNSLGICPGCIASVSLYVRDPYYNLSDISLCDDPNIDFEDFVPSAPGDPDEMMNEIYAAIAASKPLGTDNEVSVLTTALLKKFEDEFRCSSAAKAFHHNLLHGLLYHTYRMVLAASVLCNVYTRLDRELLICSTALHDIGKIVELSTTKTGEAYYTVNGRLFGHAVIGMEMISAEAKNLGLNSERITLLKHSIASHHGKEEWGAIVSPATMEAQALHLVDLLDARMYQFEETYDHTEPGKLSGKVFGLDNATIYHPIYDPFNGFFEGDSIAE